MTSFAQQFLHQSSEVCKNIVASQVDDLASALANVRETGGRLFVLGVGGSAANAAHAVNDFRKLCDIETYAPTDNVSELTARTNDEGWETVFRGWLETSRLNAKDALLVFSVGGGNEEHNVSMNIVNALKYAQEVGAKSFGIVSRDGGYTKKAADICILIPIVDSGLVTPHAEAFQAVIWHCLVSHPVLQKNATKW